MHFLGVCRSSDGKLKNPFIGCKEKRPVQMVGKSNFFTVLAALWCGVSLSAFGTAAHAQSDIQESGLPGHYMPGSGSDDAGTVSAPVNFAGDSVGGAAEGGGSGQTGNQVVNYFPAAKASDQAEDSLTRASNGASSDDDPSLGPAKPPSTDTSPGSSSGGDGHRNPGTTLYTPSKGTQISLTVNNSQKSYLQMTGEGELNIYANTEIYDAYGINQVFPTDPTQPPPYGAASLEAGTTTVDGNPSRPDVTPQKGGIVVGTNSYTIIGRNEGSTATLNIKNGAVWVSGGVHNEENGVPSSILIGLGGGSTGVVNVDGSNNTRDDGGTTYSGLISYGKNGAITVGNGDQTYGEGAAYGTLNLTNGGFATADRVIVGNYAQGNGTINVGNADADPSTGKSTLNAGGAAGNDGKFQINMDSGLYVNSAGHGTVNINKNGVVLVQGRVFFGDPKTAYNANKGSGILNINGGALYAGDLACTADSIGQCSGGHYEGIVSSERNYALNISNDGTLGVRDQRGSLSTSVDMHLTGNANFQTNDGRMVLAGNLNGTGNLILNENLPGAQNSLQGDLQLSSANSYTGLTVVNQGSLTLTGNGSLASKEIRLGSRKVIKDGKVVNDDKGNPTVNHGQLIIEKEQTTVLNQDIVHDENAEDFTDGGIKQAGNGLTILGGNNSYKGITEVNRGTLRINGDQTGATGDTVVDANGQTLGGHGTIGGNVYVQDGSFLAPGAGRQAGEAINSVLTINGDLTLQRTSNLVIVTNSGETQQAIVNEQGLPTGGNYSNSDSVYVKGKASIGTNAVVKVERGDQIRYGKAYRLLTAEKGISVSGGLNQLKAHAQTPTYYFLTPDFYFADNRGDGPRGLDFKLNRKKDDQGNVVKFESVAWTHNQHEVGRVLDGLPNQGIDSDVAQALAQVSNASEARAAQKSLSGELHASLRTALIEDSYYLREAVVDRVAQAMCDDNATGANIHTADLRTHRRNDGRCIKGHPIVWGQAYGNMGHNSGGDNASSMHHSTAGFILGADAPIEGNDDWRVGVVASYGNSTFNLAGEDSSGNSHNVSVGAYSGGKIGNFRLAVGADYAWNMITTNRRFSIAGYGTSLHAHYDGGTAQVYADLAYPLHVGRVTQLEPFVNASYINLHTNRFRETGTYGMLTGKTRDDSVFYTTFGVRASTKVLVNDVILTPHVMVAYRHGFGDIRSKIKNRFREGGGTMDIHGLALSEDEIVMDLGMRVNVTRDINIDVSYIGQYGGRSSASGAKADLKARF